MDGTPVEIGLTTVVAAFLLLEEEEEEEEEESNRAKRNTRRRERWAQLSQRERDERTRSMPRPSLLLPVDSPWLATYKSGSDRALITLTGLNFAAFERLHVQFAEYFHAYSPYGDNGRIRLLNPIERRGRKRLVTSHACLGLVLMWTRTTCQYWVLSTTFGFIGTTCSDWLQFGKRILVHVLASRRDCLVQLPDADKVNRTSSASQQDILH